MTDREKAIVMAYTGVVMLTGDKFQIFHKYVEDIMRRPVFVHEIAELADTIKMNSRYDFLKLCEEETKSGYWIDDTSLGYHVSICSNCNWRGHGDTCLIYRPKYCPNCGNPKVGIQKSEGKYER